MLFECEHCKFTKEVPDKFMGKKGKCPNCKTPVEIAPKKENPVAEEGVAAKVSATSKLPKSEREEGNKFDKFLYVVMDKLGLTSGLGLIAWGFFWFVWSLVNYFITQGKAISAVQEMVVENFFNQAQLSAILIALGVVVMEIKKLKESQ